MIDKELWFGVFCPNCNKEISGEFEKHTYRTFSFYLCPECKNEININSYITTAAEKDLAEFIKALETTPLSEVKLDFHA